MSKLDVSQKIACLLTLREFRANKIDLFRTMFALDEIISRPQRVEIKTAQVPTIEYCATRQSNEVTA